MSLSPEYKIKQLILYKATKRKFNRVAEIDENYGDFYDYEEEIRSGQEETDIAPEYDRNYESRSVAAKMLDGSWVGWTYWYGGGKHGEPESMPWMSEAYDLDCHEYEKTIVVRDFKKKKK